MQDTNIFIPLISPLISASFTPAFHISMVSFIFTVIYFILRFFFTASFFLFPYPLSLLPLFYISQYPSFSFPLSLLSPLALQSSRFHSIFPPPSHLVHLLRRHRSSLDVSLSLLPSYLTPLAYHTPHYILQHPISFSCTCLTPASRSLVSF